MMANAATRILSHALMLTAVFIESPYDAPLRARTSARADPLLTAYGRTSLGRRAEQVGAECREALFYKAPGRVMQCRTAIRQVPVIRVATRFGPQKAADLSFAQS